MSLPYSVAYAISLDAKTIPVRNCVPGPCLLLCVSARELSNYLILFNKLIKSKLCLSTYLFNG